MPPQEDEKMSGRGSGIIWSVADAAGVEVAAGGVGGDGRTA